MNDKERLLQLTEKASLALLGALFVLFPLVFANVTTDFFALPKQALLIFVVLGVVLLFGIKTVFAEKLGIVRTPYDIPILLFIGALLLSALFSVAKYDSFYNFVPVMTAAISFFAITYNTKNQKSLNILILSLILGGALVSLVELLQALKVYIFPLNLTQSPVFTPLGSSLDSAIYLGLLLVLGVYYLYPFIKSGKSLFTKNKASGQVVILAGLTFVVGVGFIVSIYNLIRLQPALILPLQTGFQTAFAAISQDSQRLIRGFLFGSGYGEFSISFLRFKQAAFNSNANIWNLTFFRSSTYILELLATTGLLGILSFLFLVYKIIREKKPFIPLFAVIAAAFLLPFSFYHIALIFFILGIDAAARNLAGNSNFFELELSLMVSKRGYFVLSEGSGNQKFGKALTATVMGIALLFSAVVGFLSYDFLNANMNFQKSLVFAQANNGTQTYAYQTSALNSLTGRYVDAYHRVFSQTNLALANSLATSLPKGSSPSAQQQQTITSLVQQSINSGRNATTVSPYNATNWQNLSSIYKSLIGFGQNADSFAILAAQQATTLDPTNPNEYINLGGIYYQLKGWDNAISQFTTAVRLKPDFPNALYNLGFAYWQKGDYQNAKAALERVKQLVANDKASLDKVNGDLKNLDQQTQTPQVNQSETALPTQNPPVKIPAPTTVVSPSPTTAPSPTATP